MPHIIEPAKSGRARCRKCKQAIAKGELRFGEEVVNAFSDGGEMTFQWHHVTCAAERRPEAFAEALAAFAGEVPDRAALEQLVAAARAKQKPAAFPYAERAPSGRSRCLSCGEPIAKGDLRIAVERKVDTGAFVGASAGYLHPHCAAAHTEDPDLLVALRANNRTLTEDELAQLAESL